MVDALTGAAASAGGSNRHAKPDDKSALSSDFETFLRMLTVQVQNQDPLNPVDSNDYATQLATFSGVEQQVLTNDLLTAMSEALGGGGLREASGWIGMEALARAPVGYSGQPVTVRPSIAEDADTAFLVVRDEAGSIVQRQTLDPGQESAVWTGLDETGTEMPHGRYRLEVESWTGTDLISSELANTYTRVLEVRQDGDDVLVRLSDGSEIPSTMITGLRAPPEVAG